MERAWLAMQRDGGGQAVLGGSEMGFDAQERKEVFHHRVALNRTIHQAHELHVGSCFGCQCHERIPIAGGGPVALYGVGAGRIGLRFHANGVAVNPIGFGMEIAHHAKRQVNIGARADVACEFQCQPLRHGGRNEKQRRGELRTHMPRNFNRSALDGVALDAQGRKARLPFVVNGCAKLPQRVHQNADRTLLHARCSGEDVLALANRQIGR